MMKKATYLLALLIALLPIGCRHHVSDTEGLTDGEKLEALDFQIEKHPKDAAALYERSQVLFNLGRTKEAVADIERAVELQPDNLTYRLQEADLHFASGNVEKSYRDLTAAEELAPQSIDVQLKMGEVTFYSRDYDRSMRCLNQVIEQDPDNQTALFMKGFIFKEKGDTASAVHLLSRVCDLYPDYEPAFEELGILYSSRNNPLAVEYLGTALQLQPSNTNAIYALAMYHQANANMDIAEELYRRMLDINPQSADALHNLGYIELTHYHDYQRAAEYFDRALQADPDHEAAAENRKLAYELLNIQ